MTRLIEVTHLGEDYATIKIKYTGGEFQTSRGVGEAILRAYEREERQAKKQEVPDGTITVEMFTRVDNDVYGNPRYYVPVYHFGELTDAKRSKAGLTKYRGKRYGAGYVVQSYNLESTVNHINKTIL